MKSLAMRWLVLGTLLTIANATLDSADAEKPSTDLNDHSAQKIDHNDPLRHPPDPDFYNPISQRPPFERLNNEPPPSPPNPDSNDPVIYQPPSIPNSHQESPSFDSHRLNSPLPSPPTYGSRHSRSVNLQRPSIPGSHQESPSSDSHHLNSPVPSPPTSGSRHSRSVKLESPTSPQYDTSDKALVPAGRFKRDASKSSQLYIHASIIARMVNGIALQSGLMDGSIKMDDVLPELLHLGKIKVSEVAAFKSDPLTKFINEVKSMPETLKADQDFVNFEDKTVVWDEFRNAYESLPDFQNYPTGEKFFDDVQQFRTSGLFKRALLIENGFKDLQSHLNDIEEQTNPGNIAKYRPFEDFGSTYKEICEVFANITGIHKGLQEEPQFVRSLSELKHVDNFIRIVKSRNESDLPVGTAEEKKPLLVKKFDALQKLKTSSSSAEKEVRLLASVAESRYNSQRTTRKLTSGFSNGLPDVLQLSNDTSNSWIEKVLSGKGDIQSLGKGFRPLIKNMERAGPVDSQLKTISSPDFVRAVTEFAQIQQQISTLHPSVADYSTIFDNTSECGKKSNVDISEIESIVNRAKSLPNLLEKPRSSLPTLFNLDLTDFKKQVDEFIKSWKFTTAPSKQQLEDTVKTLNTIKIGNLRDILNTFKTQTVDVVGAASLDDNSDKILTIRKNVAIFFKNDAQEEKNVLTCLQQYKEKSEAAANGIKLIRNLRSQDSEAIGKVESAVNAFSQASKTLPTLNSIPAEIKKDSNSHVTDMNNLTDSLKRSQNIGESVNSLRASVGLKNLESKLPELRRMDAAVKKKLSNRASPFEKQTAEKLWGNHLENVASLEAGIKEAIEFDSKLDVPKARRIRAAEFKFIADLGKQLPDLAKIRDVDFNAKDKEKVMDICSRHSNDPQEKAQFEKWKALLHEIDGYDFNFSKHKKTLEGAPKDFNIIEEFFLYYIGKKTEEDEEERKAAKIEEKKSNWLTYAGITTAGVFVVALVGIALFIIIRKRYKLQESHDAGTTQEPLDDPHRLIENFKNDRIASAQMFFDSGKRMFNILDRADGKIKNKGIKFPDGHARWNNVFCNKQTAVYVKKDGKMQPLHANRMRTSLNNKFIATQAPKPDTIPLFLEMILSERLNNIVMLCKWVEQGSPKANRYFDDKLGGEMKFGNYTVKTTDSEKIIGGSVTKRTLKIVDNEDASRDLEISHYQYEEWPDMGVPKDPVVVCQLLELVVGETPVVVHCSAGAGRTGAFIGIQYLVDEGRVNPDFEIISVLHKLRRSRWHALQKQEQVMFVMVGYVYLISKRLNISMEYYEKYLKYYEEALTMMKKGGSKVKQESTNQPAGEEKREKEVIGIKSAETSGDDPSKPSLHV